ncbi:phosphodiester glycosidase family protein [Iningainema tapete]|uniref:Phosphodiester glycosidase family protein n=1 Tax=Iningainema tapete BLCC-T55 TaxID=2748662 RepID=A0A8J6XR98_9CYAN|nr:phosphodiester glycosidase family protein [Iningainema tapete]MBD2776905.1 phosphodiester glycosidase family protein [Iningainema tapete BLCC-T55]
MHLRSQVHLQRFALVAGTLVLLLPMLIYGWLCFLRPPRTDQQQVLFNGIVYRRDARSTPRPMMIHIVTIDLTSPGVKVFVTPSTSNQSNSGTIARTTSEFIQEFKLQLAINASYFFPFSEKTPWDYYPHSGDYSTPIGESISNSHRYTKEPKKWPVLCISASNIAQILDSGRCPEGTVQGITSNKILLSGGKPQVEKSQSQQDKKPYSRVAAAINRQGTILWLIAVDGKQPLYSAGITDSELTQIAKELGADTALNLDGGGSTTLVMATITGSRVLNAPIHTKIPLRERPVANHLGFYALPASNQ